MNKVELIKKYRNLNEEELSILINNNELNNLTSEELNILFLNVNNECKIKIIDNINLLKKILSIPQTKTKKTIFDLVDDDIKQYIYNHNNLLLCKDNLTNLQIHLQKLSKESFLKIVDNKNLNNAFNIDSVKIIDEKYNLTTYEYLVIKQEIISERFSNISLFQIKNKEELIIYSKFHILVNIDKVIDNNIIINNIEIPYNYILTVNKKHINSLIEESPKENITNNILFITIMKMYMTLGLDNSKKVLHNFFTYSTNSSLKRTSEEFYKDLRRNYRLQNQDKFYYYGIEEKIENTYLNNNLDYLEDFCGDPKNKKIFLKKIAKALKINNVEKKKETLKEIIIDEINKREKYYHEILINKYIEYYSKRIKNSNITITELYNIFSKVNYNYKITKDGKIIPNDKLIKVLLGNCKKDNDCLLRMVINKGAFGLNDELYQIINNFDKISSIAESNSSLSIYSISDIIDISKIFLYNLKPDELDITLETLSKILKSRQYCTEPPEVILDRIMHLHKERKFKLSCAIPFINGELASGIDTESCFKVGGKGEDFFQYCLISPLGFVLELNYQNTNYILPSTINGNMVNINSIDPKIKDETTYQNIIEALKIISKRLIRETKNIEIVTITDIHHEQLTSNMNLKKISINKFIPLDTDVYCDYNKKEVTNYILGIKNNKVRPTYFYNNERFFIKRFNPYIISIDKEYDKERINLLINQIAYSSINFESIPLIEKHYKKETYKEINVDNYLYIIGNMDWFIGIDKNKNYVEFILPYDKRAKKEYLKYKNVIYKYIETKHEKIKRIK